MDWGGSGVSWTRAPGGERSLSEPFGVWRGSAISWTRAPGGERSLSEPFRDCDGSTNSWTRALGSARSRSEPFELWCGGIWTGSASSWTRTRTLP